MTINSNLNTFLGKRVEDFNPEKGIKNLETTAYRLRLSYDDSEEGKTIEELIDAFAANAESANVKEIIIGAFNFDMESTTDTVVERLVTYKEKFKNLKAIFIGDITYEECEISWIQQTNVGPVLEAYPQLEYFRVRGGQGLELGTLKHQNLKSLIVETGGLPPNVVSEVNNAELPNLEHLELWLGSDNYGFESPLEDFGVIMSGAKFPKLTYLGLKDSEMEDEIAVAIAKSSVLKKLQVLDLSMGTLGDVGAQALLDSPDIKNLKMLVLNHHYMSNNMMDKMKGLGITVDMQDQEEADEDGDRYIEVSE
jgi:hypothetical protein